MGNQPSSSEKVYEYKSKKLAAEKQYGCTNEISNVVYDIVIKFIEKRKITIGLSFSDGSSFWYYCNGQKTRVLGLFGVDKVPPAYVTGNGSAILNTTYDSSMAPYILDQEADQEIVQKSEKSRYAASSKKLAEIEEKLKEEGLIDIADDLVDKLKSIQLEDIYMIDVEKKQLIVNINWRQICRDQIEKEAREVISVKYFASEDQFNRYQKIIVKYIRIYYLRIKNERNTYILKQLQVKQQMVKQIISKKPSFPYYPDEEQDTDVL